jgi:FAD:protein FMN transferase
MGKMDGDRQPMKSPSPLPDARFFSHEAMHTTFTLRLRGVDEADARGVARQCFERIDFLENQLSRFIDGSDVSRINRLAAGETLYLGEACHQCLLLAVDAAIRTRGLFDITLGTRIEHRKSGADGPEPEVAGKLTIHPDIAAITCDEPGREIDLGGIGKGFALDQLKLLLADWGVEDALLAAGASSLLAIGPQAWPVDLTCNSGGLRIALTNQSLSASGTGIQGSHIVHPWGPDAMPAEPSKRIWVAAPSAALAEVWSTALMLIEAEEIADFIAGDDTVSIVYVERNGGIARVC